MTDFGTLMVRRGPLGVDAGVRRDTDGGLRSVGCLGVVECKTRLRGANTQGEGRECMASLRRAEEGSPSNDPLVRSASSSSILPNFGKRLSGAPPQTAGDGEL
eukprot:5319057-Pyramimonas_sp.AAC.1